METTSSSVCYRGLSLPASVLRRSDLSSGCKLLLGTLCQLARANGHCWPSHQYLADELGMSRKTVQNHLQALFQAKLVEIRRGRAGAVLRYYPLQEMPTSSAGGQVIASGQIVKGGQVAQPSVTPANKGVGGCVKVTQGCVRVTHNKNINNINTYPPYPPRGERRGRASLFTPEEEAEFARLWAAWPVHQGEQSAKRIFLRLHRTNTLPEVNALIRTVAMFQEQDSRWMRGKVKLLANWLRGHCWNDAPYVEPRPAAGHGAALASMPISAPELPPGLSERVLKVQETCSRAEQPSPLPDPDALDSLLTMWPDRPKSVMEPMIRGVWRHTLSVRSLSGTRVVEAARRYLAGVEKTLRLEQWLRLECSSTA